MMKGLYVNHRKQQCGVYEFGKEIGDLLLSSKKFKFHYCECDSLAGLKTVYSRICPDIIIYNYHPSTMAWVNIKGRWNAPLTCQLPAIHVGTIHEVYQQAADEANDKIFDFHIAPDPTLFLKNPLVYKTGRLLPNEVKLVETKNTLTTIGSFGFATQGKGFQKIITLVQDEYDEAIIKLNIAFARFGDNDGSQAKEIADECRQLIYKPSIQLDINHDYLSKDELIAFLSSNDLNVFLYDDQEARGISSATDWAMAAGRPFAISKSRLFRHLLHCRPSISVADNSLKTILANGLDPIKHLWSEFSSLTILWEYESIIDKCLKKKNKTNIKARNTSRFYLEKVLRRIGLLNPAIRQSNNIWTKTDDEFTFSQKHLKIPNYEPVSLPANISYNRILDNKARELYNPAINFLVNNFPKLIAKKIPEANVQQAFVFDTAVRLSNNFEQPRLLAVGSFEDTAVEALKLLNYKVCDIDPIFNYDLAEYITKPNVHAETFDIIVSTSVIEHVEDDEQFVNDISHLLIKGGFAILTCDYNDQYKPGDDIPEVDFRFYTQLDLKERLIKAIPDCELIDTAQWDCEHPDFFYLEKYNYTFASFVFKKIR